MKRSSFAGLAATSALAASLLVPATTVAEAGHLHSCFGKRVTLRGTFARDVIQGTAGPDVIVAGGGDDLIFGNDGNDRICGNSGRDTILGGEGFDRSNGGGGKDSCEAERRRRCE